MPNRRPRSPRKPADILSFPAGAPVPDEILSSQAKDRIADVVKKAAGGGRTTIVSRGYPIAIIGPVEDIPAASRVAAVRLATTEIKSGQTSLKGVIARGDYTLLTIHGEARAAVYRPKVLSRPEHNDSRLERLVDRLDTSEILERFLASVQAEIERSLALLDEIDRDKSAALRARYKELRKRS